MEAWTFGLVFYGVFILPVIVPAVAMAHVSKRHHWSRFWLAGAGIWVVCTGGAVLAIFSRLRF